MRASGLLEALSQDLRFALRILRKSPGFTAVAILTLALAIGANTSIFTILNTVMLTRLPVSHPQELVLFHWVAHTQGPYVWSSSHSYGGCDMVNPASHSSNCAFSFPDYDNFRTHSQSLQGIAAYGGGVGVQVDWNGQATRANGQYVNGDFFSVLQVRPACGRMLTSADDSAAATAAIVLDFHYWQMQFNSDPNVVGRSVLLNGVPFTIAGIAPPEFYGLAPGSRANFWIPLHARDSLVKDRFDKFEARSIWLYLVGRLKPGVPAERARVEAEVMFRASLTSEASAVAASTKPNPDHPNQAIDTDLGITFTSAERGLASLRLQYSTQLFVLMAAAGLVLLIACANIANLLLARAEARRKEIAVRLALGASRPRLLSQLLTESMLLAFLGCAAGVLVSYWATRGLVYVLFSSKAPAAFLATIRPNYVVLGFSAAVAVVAAILFGLVPALTSTRVTLGSTLKIAGTNASPCEGRSRLGRTLVTLEMAVALVLVIGAGLFVRTLITLETLDPGFRTDHLLLFSISPTAAKVPEERIPALGREIRSRLAALPGIESVTWSGFPLLYGGVSSTSVSLVEHPDLGNELETQILEIGPGYFETMKIPVLSGRSITLQDCRKDSLGIWINRAFANKYLKGAPAMGAHVKYEEKTFEVMGIVGDVKYQSVKADFRPTVYIPMPSGDFSFQVRTAVNPQAMENRVRSAVAEIASTIAIQDVGTLQEGIDSTLSTENAMARLSAGLGFLALLLAAIGIYGVLAYSVTRRTSEIAIRMSLGAMPDNILRLILKEGLTLAFLGAVVGLLASWALTRLVQQFLYGVKALDPVTFSLATAILLVIAAVACVVPARRATRVDPVIGLRYE